MNKLIEQFNIIKSINIENLSGLSKIYLSSIIALTDDLLNDEIVYCENNDHDENNNHNENNKNIKININYDKILHEISCIWSDYKKYYTPWDDFYPDKSNPSVTFLTYINEKSNNYLSYDDIQVKILVLNNFIECYSDYKHSKYFSTVKIDKIKKILELWKSQLIKKK